MYGRVFHDQGTNNQPEGVSGRDRQDHGQSVQRRVQPAGRAVGHGSPTSSRSATTRRRRASTASRRSINGIDFGNIVLNLSGSVANTGIAGQGANSGIVVPGGLVRANSATNGRGQPYDPYTVSFIDSVSYVRGNHFLKTGGEIRAIRMSTDRLGGITYSFANVTAFLNNTASTVQYLGDVSAPSPFNNGATGPASRAAGVLHRLRAGRVARQPAGDAEPRPALRVLHAADRNPRPAGEVQHRHRRHRSEHDAGRTRRRRTTSCRALAFTYAPGKTVFRTGFGMFVGPGQTEDQIQPVESDRVSSTLSNGSFPVDQNALVANFVNNPNNRSFQPRAYANDYSIPERIYQYTASVQRELPGNMSATAAYVGSQGRNLFLRSVANNIVQVLTNPNPANAALVVREFSIPVRDATGNITERAEPVRRGGLQDERRAGQLQRAAAVAEQAVVEGPGDQRAVHVRPEPRQHRRIERGADRREQRARA